MLRGAWAVVVLLVGVLPVGALLMVSLMLLMIFLERLSFHLDQNLIVHAHGPQPILQHLPIAFASA
jgi:hypothetical protein